MEIFLTCWINCLIWYDINSQADISTHSTGCLSDLSLTWFVIRAFESYSQTQGQEEMLPTAAFTNDSCVRKDHRVAEENTLWDYEELMGPAMSSNVLIYLADY